MSFECISGGINKNCRGQEVGRFTQVDPATATEAPNLYTYVSNMVTRMVDPSGTSLRDHFSSACRWIGKQLCRVDWDCVWKWAKEAGTAGMAILGLQCGSAIKDAMEKACELRKTYEPPEDTAGRFNKFKETEEYKRLMKYCPKTIVDLFKPFI